MNPHALATYAVLRKYYEDRMDTPGIHASDTQLAKLQDLLFVKRKLPVRFEELQCRLAARLIPARMAYARHKRVPFASVTVADLEESPEGVWRWLVEGDPSKDAFDGPQPFKVEHHPKKCVMKISKLLNEREEWLCEKGLDSDTEMDMVQREEFVTWSVNKYLLLPGKSVPDEPYDESLMRFWREQERRVGSTEMWEALSYTRLVEPQDVRNAFKAPATKRRVCITARPKPRPSRRGMETGSQSAVDGAGEPVAEKRPRPATALCRRERQLCPGHQNKRSRKDIRAITYLEGSSTSREEYACNLWRRAEPSVTSREDQASMSRGDVDPVTWFKSLCNSQQQTLMATVGRTA